MTSGRFATASRLAACTLLVLGIVAASVVGCAPEPAPTPTPTPAFASEEEAFAAAEKVYRAYNDAANARLRNQPQPDPQDFLTGLALDGDIDAQNSLASAGIRLVGEATVTSFRGIESLDPAAPSARVTAVVCINVSALQAVDSSGMEVTPPERGDTVAQLVTFTGAAERLLIAEESSAEASTC